MLMSVDFDSVAVASHSLQNAGMIERVTLSAIPMYRYSHVSGIASTRSMMADEMSSTDISAFFVWRRSQIVQLTANIHVKYFDLYTCRIKITSITGATAWI